MLLKRSLTGSIILLCACSTTSMPASKRVSLDYDQPKNNSQAYLCMKECNDIARSCEHYEMHGDAILSESFNKNKCINDESKCLKRCGINVKVIEKSVDIFGFTIDEPDKKSNYDNPLTSIDKKSYKEERSDIGIKANKSNLEKLNHQENKSEDKPKSSRWSIFKNYKRSQSFENF